MHNPANQLLNPPRQWEGPTSEARDPDEADREMARLEDPLNRELVRGILLSRLLAQIAPPGLRY